MAKKNPIQRALDQAGAITSGNQQLERLTQGQSAGPGPLFNDRREGTTDVRVNSLGYAVTSSGPIMAHPRSRKAAAAAQADKKKKKS